MKDSLSLSVSESRLRQNKLNLCFRNSFFVFYSNVGHRLAQNGWIAANLKRACGRTELLAETTALEKGGLTHYSPQLFCRGKPENGNRHSISTAHMKSDVI